MPISKRKRIPRTPTPPPWGACTTPPPPLFTFVPQSPARLPPRRDAEGAPGGGPPDPAGGDDCVRHRHHLPRHRRSVAPTNQPMKTPRGGGGRPLKGYGGLPSAICLHSINSSRSRLVKAFFGWGFVGIFAVAFAGL